MTLSTSIDTWPNNILVVQFKYLGDAVIITPAIEALKKKYPQASIHLLIPLEFTPIFKDLLIADNIIGLPRERGSLKFFKLGTTLVPFFDLCNDK